MREFSLHFYTNTPCNVFVNGEMIGFIDNKDNFFIDIVSFSEQLIISCEPICEDNILYLPCSFRLNYVGNNLICSSNNIEIVPFPNHNFDIILDCKLMMVNSKSTLLSKKIDGYTILTMVDTISTLSIFLDDKNLYTCKYAQLSNLEYERTKDLILVKGNSNNNVFFLAFNTTDNKVVLSGTYSSIEKTKDNTGLTLNIAFNYGGRPEIVNAMKHIAQDVKDGKLDIDNITEETISDNLYTAGMPDPDLMIRPGGELRISNFLPWQLVYSEFCFPEEYWPAFGEQELMKAIEVYQKRNRRFGGRPEEKQDNVG